jgi:hypothetical protein
MVSMVRTVVSIVGFYKAGEISGNVIIMMNPFDGLYAGMEKALGALKGEGEGRYAAGLAVIAAAVGDVRKAAARIRPGVQEVDYCRHVWPVFHSIWWLHMRLYKLEERRGRSGPGVWERLIADQEGRVAAFWQRNDEFWAYYLAGAQVLDHQFTRAYSRGLILDPRAAMMDREGATVASWRAARCLEAEGLGRWLRGERARLEGGLSLGGEYTWAGTEAELAEWLLGAQVTGVIHYRGQAADLQRLNQWARGTLGREVKNIYDRIRHLRGRKKTKTAFTERTQIALERRFARAET